MQLHFDNFTAEFEPDFMDLYSVEEFLSVIKILKVADRDTVQKTKKPPLNNQYELPFSMPEDIQGIDIYIIEENDLDDFDINDLF